MSDTQIPLTENGLHQVNGIWWLVQPRGVIQNAVGLPNNLNPFKKTTIKRSNWMPQYDLKSTYLDIEGQSLENMIEKTCVKQLMAGLPNGEPQIKVIVGDYARVMCNIHRTHNQGSLNLHHIDALSPPIMRRIAENLELSNLTTVTILGVQHRHRTKLENFMRLISWKNRRINLQFEEAFATNFPMDIIKVPSKDVASLKYLGGNLPEPRLRIIGARHLKELMRSNHAFL